MRNREFALITEGSNQKMKADSSPIPKNQEILGAFICSRVFSTLEYFSEFWQVRLEEKCQERKKFLCRLGTYKFDVMTFGLMKDHSKFKRMTYQIMEDIPFVRVYLEDVIVLSNSMDDHLKHLKEEMDLVIIHELKLRTRKFFFVKKEEELLGHILVKFGVYP